MVPGRKFSSTTSAVAHSSQRDLLPALGAQVERHGRLVAGQHGPPQRVVVVAQAAPVAHRVAGRRRLDLDDLGPEVAQQGPDVGAGQQLAELQDPDALEGPVGQVSRRRHPGPPR